MTWFSFILSVIKLLTAISNWRQQSKLIETAEAKARAEALSEVLSSLAKANGVILEFKDKDDAAVDKTIEERGWYRD